jgi:hypothetical protein
MRIAIVGNTTELENEIVNRFHKTHWVMQFNKDGSMPCNTADEEQLEGCVRFMLDTWDGIDALLICAQNWKNVITAFYPIMDQADSPKIVIVSKDGYNEPEFIQEFSEKNPRVDVSVVNSFEPIEKIISV